MRVQVNEQAVHAKTTAAQRASIIGIATLVAAVVVSFRPSIPYYIALAYSLSLIGLFIVSWSSRIANKWMGDLRGDKVLGKALKSLGGSYFLYSYVLPADHVLLSPSGLTALTLKAVDGKVRCNGDSWHRQLTPGRIFRALGEEQLGNPTRQAQREAKRLETWVRSNLPEAEVPVDAVVVFIHPNAELEVHDPVVPALTVGDLKEYLRTRSEEKMSPEANKSLKQLLNELVR